MNLLGKPTIEFCEKAGPGLIKRPFYAFSNLAYFFIGLIILHKGKGSRISKAFGYFSILIGFLSFVYDASYTYFSQLMDLLGMFLFINLLIYFSTKRYFKIPLKKQFFLQFLAVLIGMFSVVYFKSFAGEFVFGTFIIFYIGLEFLLWKADKTVDISLWLKGLTVFILGFIVWLPDVTGLICDSNNYINGRSIFHILTSVTIYILYKYHELQEIKFSENIWNNENLIKTLKNGGVVVMPTDTLYGIVGKAQSKSVVERIYKIRKRNPAKPSIVLVGDLAELKKFGIVLTEEQKNEIGKYREPTSVVLDCPDDSFAYLHRGTKTLAFRIPSSQDLQNLLLKTGPLIVPSTNPEGLPPAEDISKAKEYFGDFVDLYIDGGKIIGKASKVIKLHQDGTVDVLRK